MRNTLTSQNAGLSLSQASDLADRLTARAPEGFRVVIEGDRIAFLGGPNGGHSIDIGASSAARVLAHWEGYLVNAAEKAQGSWLVLSGWLKANGLPTNTAGRRLPVDHARFLMASPASLTATQRGWLRAFVDGAERAALS